jgi:hypothetical protein
LPIEARAADRAQRRLDEALSIDFQNCAERYIEAHESSWRGAKSAKQWRSSLATYAHPVLGALPVAAIDTALVLRVIEPIWAKRETASRVRGRIESILDWSTVRGFRKGDNPARWKGHLDKLLPGKVRAVQHHPAMPWAELPTFLAELRNHVGVAARFAAASRAMNLSSAAGPWID